MHPSGVSGPRAVYPSFRRWSDPALFSSARLSINPSAPEFFRLLYSWSRP